MANIADVKNWSNDDLLAHAVRFFIGDYTAPDGPKAYPLWLEATGKGWAVRLQLSDMNPHYLNFDEPAWRYKSGTSFLTRQQALQRLAEVGGELS